MKLKIQLGYFCKSKKLKKIKLQKKLPLKALLAA
jgi:hypothetical protein